LGNLIQENGDFGHESHPFRHHRNLENQGFSVPKRGEIGQLSVKVSVTPQAVQEFFRNSALSGRTPPLLFNGFQFVSVK
jgi:hypothetical protein